MAYRARTIPVAARHQARKETPLCLRKYRPKTHGKAPHGSTGGYDQLVKPRVQDLPEGREPRLEERGANHRLRQLNAQTQTYRYRPTKSGPPNQRGPGTISLKKLKHHRSEVHIML